jgi:hypothetical protein
MIGRWQSYAFSSVQRLVGGSPMFWRSVQRLVGGSPMSGELCKDLWVAVLCLDICSKICRRQSPVWISVQRLIGGSPMFGDLCKDQ